jgi:hypothetical protein
LVIDFVGRGIIYLSIKQKRLIMSLFLFGGVEMKQYIWRVLLALDQLGNALTGGSEDETISSRMGKHLAKHDK